MLNIFKRNQGFLIVATLVLGAIVFSCRGLTLGQMGSLAHVGSHADMSMPPVHASCCAFSDMGATALVHGQYQSALPAVYVLLFVFILLFFPFPTVRLLSRAPSLIDRHRMNSTRLFVYYVRLFSQGILNPKTF